ncbi:hypothetical protein CHUAL_014268 [Chamberlinius hualienensis]
MNRLLLFSFISTIISQATSQELGDAQAIQCPLEYSVQLFPHTSHCDHFYKCENGTLSHETCANGLLFDGRGSVHNHCNYDWAVDCGTRKQRAPPISNQYCPYLWGIFPIGPGCATQYYKCAEGAPIQTPCEPGLVYDDRIHKCNWPDLVPQCDSEAVIGFKCPAHATGLSARFYPFPRYAYPADCNRYIICTEGKPRLIGCGDLSAFNPATLTCEDIKNVPSCKPL